MIDVLNKIPITPTLIKRTKIGKAINYILKADNFNKKIM